MPPRRKVTLPAAPLADPLPPPVPPVSAAQARLSATRRHLIDQVSDLEWALSLEGTHGGDVDAFLRVYSSLVNAAQGDPERMTELVRILQEAHAA